MAHQVHLEWPDGDTESVSVGDTETVVDAAESAGIGLPYGCLTGACGTCTGRLLSEDDPRAVFEYHRRPRALKQRHHEAGYVLLCVASPRADCRVAVGSSIQAELVENPWK